MSRRDSDGTTGLLVPPLAWILLASRSRIRAHRMVRSLPAKDREAMTGRPLNPWGVFFGRLGSLTGWRGQGSQPLTSISAWKYRQEGDLNIKGRRPRFVKELGVRINPRRPLCQGPVKVRRSDLPPALQPLHKPMELTGQAPRCRKAARKITLDLSTRKALTYPLLRLQRLP